MNKRCVLIGILGLFAGTFEYVMNRTFNTVYFLERFRFINNCFYSLLPDIYGNLGGWVPEFFHAFSFSLICIGLFSKTRRSKIMFCLLWFGINSLFELGQNYGTHIVRYIPVWFNKVPVLENAKYFFLNGTFDIFDILASLFGVVGAYVIGELISGGKKDERNFARESITEKRFEILEEGS